MDHSTLPHHHQEMMGSDESLDSMLAHTKKGGNEGAGQIIQGQGQGQDQKKPKPPDEVQKCPRCDSTNTKFCYYNNYSLSQPRYFCKSCRRYWTKGGTLRNVPVGGGCRKNRRSSSSSSSSSSRRCTPDHHLMIASSAASSPPPPPHLVSTFENIHPHHAHAHALSTNDLSLAFARLQKHGGGGGFDNHGNISLLGNSHFDLFGNSFVDPQHLYYGGLGGNNNNNNANLNTHEDQRMAAMSFDHQHYQHHQSNQEMMSNPSSGTSTPTTIKQEMGENKVLWGLPWQISNGGGGGGGGEGNYMNAAAASVVAAASAAAAGGGNNEFGDSLKDSWNHVGVLNPTNWHSLLNSPLM